MRIYKPNNIEVPKMKALIYGTPGQGKTRLAYSAAFLGEMCPILGINVGGNPVSIRDYPQYQIDIVDIEDVRDINTVINWLYSRDKNVGLPDKNYKTVIVDGISDVQTLFSTIITGGSRIAEIPRGFDNYKQWGQLLEMSAVFARALYKLDMHVIITALENYRDSSGQYVPLLFGQSTDKITPMPYMVGRLTSHERTTVKVRKQLADQKVDNLIQLRSTSEVPYTKWQYGEAPTYVINPTMEKLVGSFDTSAKA